GECTKTSQCVLPSSGETTKPTKSTKNTKKKILVLSFLRGLRVLREFRGYRLPLSQQAHRIDPARPARGEICRGDSRRAEHDRGDRERHRGGGADPEQQ